MCRPPTQTATGRKREDMRAKKDIKGVSSNERVVSRRLRVSWWRPSTDRTSAARPGGSVPKRGRPSSRSAAQRACVAKRASRASLPVSPPSRSVRGRDDGAIRAVERGMPVPRAGRPHVEPTDVYSCPSQEGGYSAREARKGRPSTRSGDACRGWTRLLAV